MKKSFILLFTISCTALSVFSENFSFIDKDLDLKGNIHREGENLRIQYNISGINSINTNNLSKDEKALLSQFSTVKMNMLINCKEPKIKILNANFTGINGENSRTQESSEWINLENSSDIAKVKELCSKY